MGSWDLEAGREAERGTSGTRSGVPRGAQGVQEVTKGGERYARGAVEGCWVGGVQGRGVGDARCGGCGALRRGARWVGWRGLRVEGAEEEEGRVKPRQAGHEKICGSPVAPEAPGAAGAPGALCTRRLGLHPRGR